MTQGKLYEKILEGKRGQYTDSMWSVDDEIYFEVIEVADGHLKSILDEAKKDLPKRRSVVLPQPIDLTDKTVLREKHRQEAINEAIYLQDIEKWIKKWFGDVTQ